MLKKRDEHEQVSKCSLVIHQKPLIRLIGQVDFFELCLKECMMIFSNNVKIYSYIVNVKPSADRSEYSRNLISETKHNK